jgi:hypothetical protein
MVVGLQPGTGLASVHQIHLVTAAHVKTPQYVVPASAVAAAVVAGTPLVAAPALSSQLQQQQQPTILVQTQPAAAAAAQPVAAPTLQQQARQMLPDDDVTSEESSSDDDMMGMSPDVPSMLMAVRPPAPGQPFPTNVFQNAFRLHGQQGVVNWTTAAPLNLNATR